jgi:SAM-dependent methyltransferase
MHDTAEKNATLFFRTYVLPNNIGKILEVGSCSVGEPDEFILRHLKPPQMEYVGLDISMGNNVDVLWDTERIPFENDTFDFVVSTSCFEHDELFWVTYLEILRVLKPNGLFYMNAPSNGVYHAYPVDCWRFYPDAAHALVKWGKRNGYKHNAVLEHYTHNAGPHNWADYVAVFIKNDMYKNEYPNRMVTDIIDNCTNPYYF